MSVAALVLEHGGCEDAAIAGLLHDSVEDSDDGTATGELIRAELGPRVSDIVAACSDAIAQPGQPKQPWRDRKEACLRHLATQADPDVLLVSACDKLHNARSIAADLRETGPALWQRSSEPDATAQIWYYQALTHCYTGRVSARRADELSRVIIEIQSLAATANTTANTSSD